MNSLLFAIVFQVLSSAPVYKLTLEDGSVTYTDKPQPGAERIDLSAVNSAVMPSMPVTTQPTQTNSKPATEYQLRFKSPLDQQQIRSNAGDMTISATISPQRGGQFSLLMDGKPVASASRPYFQLSNVDRGEHQLQIQLKDNSGKVIASSPTITVYLMRTSINTPARQ